MRREPGQLRGPPESPDYHPPDRTTDIPTTSVIATPLGVKQFVAFGARPLWNAHAMVSGMTSSDRRRDVVFGSEKSRPSNTSVHLTHR